MIIDWTSASSAADMLKRYGSERNMATALGMARSTLKDRLRKLGVGQPVAGAAKKALGKDEAEPEIVVKGSIRAPAAEEKPLPAEGEIKRYILTCVQNNTHLFDAAWESLNTLAVHYNAEIMISRFAYDKTSQARATKPGSRDIHDADDLWYDPRTAPYWADRRIVLAPGLAWCGELNILPTAVRPLSGLEAYTGRLSSVIPHVKFAMESVASGKHEATKFLYTTGCVSQRNYIQRKAGQKAEFHHGYGALLVEVNHEGSWWCRQLNADSEGTIYDLDIVAKGRLVAYGDYVEAISWGDIHVGQSDPDNARACWFGPDAMLRTLRPKYQFMHDVLDFRSRNHHERDNPHALFDRYVNGNDNVQREVMTVATFLKNAGREGTFTVIVDSNHDNAMERWLREGDCRRDPVNAIYFLEAQLAKYKAIWNRDKHFHLVEWALKGVDPDLEIVCLRQDQSFVICHDANGGIECGMHGHLGPNGRRGSANAFAKMGRKAVVGHSHSAGIVDGIYVAGTSSNLDLGYNAGPSSWSHSHVITYVNGKRAVITVWRGKWRA